MQIFYGFMVSPSRAAIKYLVDALFGLKFWRAVILSLSSFVLGAIGYNVTAGAIQTTQVVNSIWKSYTGIYFVGYGLAVAVLYFVYPLTKKKTAEMLEELKVRRAEKENA